MQRRCWFHDRQRVGPSRPDPGDDDQEGAIDRANLRPWPGAHEHRKLLQEHKDLHDEARRRSEVATTMPRALLVGMRRRSVGEKAIVEGGPVHRMRGRAFT